MLRYTPLTAPAHFIIGGVSGNEGVIISRSVDELAHEYTLSDDDWYVVITNVDTWSNPDDRFLNAVQFLDDMG